VGLKDLRIKLSSIQSLNPINRGSDKQIAANHYYTCKHDSYERKTNRLYIANRIGSDVRHKLRAAAHGRAATTTKTTGTEVKPPLNLPR